MTIYIDHDNKICYILSPKCGTQSIVKSLNLTMKKEYDYHEVFDTLKNVNYKKIIIIRDIFSRFLSGFYEDLHNNECYLDINISFIDYVKFLKYCYDNKIPSVNNLNVYFKEDKKIWWGQCSNVILPITDEKGNLSGHLIHQKTHLLPYINIIDIDDKNIEIIDIKELHKYIKVCENKKIYETVNESTFNTPLNSIKNDYAAGYPKIENMLNYEIKEIILEIYKDDLEYIDEIKKN